MPQIVWLPEALEDTRRLRLFLEDKSPTAAARAGRVIQTGANRLADFPEIGHPMNDGTDRRELFLPFGTGGTILRYIIDEQTVVIVRAWHTKEKRGER
ncbi:MAG: type II toxin-antitoxin system RelE/ParE family toxin [Methylococcaceae bacterium]|nr:type II toxin-antitoxin system RelE/ParE family toxin [Methylococcaceae bacterium]